MYDIFFLIQNKENQKLIRERFPVAKFCIIDENNSAADALYFAQKKSLTKMFWVVDVDHCPKEDFNFDLKVFEWEQKYVHSFKEEKTGMYKGVYLISKSYHITKKEAEHMFFVNKKEIDVVASCMSDMDIFFVSYDELNADENWQNLKNKYPNAKRIEKVKGIHQAHIEAATKSLTSMFWIVDADAILLDTFNFDFIDFAKTSVFFKSVYVYQSLNPINDLVYGYGGVKLLPKIPTMKMDIKSVDMTTSISPHFNSVPIASNITAFNTDPFNTWRSAFRECVKLSSKIIKNQPDLETEERLNVWCTVGKDRAFGEYAIRGAMMGREYGLANIENIEALKKINDWQWLQDEFNKL